MSVQVEQVRIHELLEDPIYRRWFDQEPSLPAVWQDPVLAHKRRWRVWIQTRPGGPWRRRSFRTWRKARRFLVKALPAIHDGALTTPAREWSQPRVTVKLKGGKSRRMAWVAVRRAQGVPWTETHRWCGYCRRPTVFKLFLKHHAFPNNYLQINLNTERRCTVCGIREGMLPRQD